MLIKISKSPAQKLHILVARGKKKNIMRVVVRVINSPHTHKKYGNHLYLQIRFFFCLTEEL